MSSINIVLKKVSNKILLFVVITILHSSQLSNGCQGKQLRIEQNYTTKSKKMKHYTTFPAIIYITCTSATDNLSTGALPFLHNIIVKCAKTIFGCIVRTHNCVYLLLSGDNIISLEDTVHQAHHVRTICFHGAHCVQGATSKINEFKNASRASRAHHYNVLYPGIAMCN